MRLSSTGLRYTGNQKLVFLYSSINTYERGGLVGVSGGVEAVEDEVNHNREV